MRLGLVLLALLGAAGAAYGDGVKPSGFGPNEGQVLQVDRAAQEITIRHGYLPELGMDRCPWCSESRILHFSIACGRATA